MKRFLIVLSAWMLTLGSLAAFAHSIRASVSQYQYYELKYGRNSTNDIAMLSSSEKAHSLYPLNYHMCIWVGEHAYNRIDDKKNGDIMLEAAQTWCDRGLMLNRHKAQLRLLKARLIAMESPLIAARYWKKYVQKDFWPPYHHAVLAEFYAKAGRYWEAVDELMWLEGTEYYKLTKKFITKSWKQDVETEF